MSIGTKPQHHSLRSVPGGKQLFVKLPPACDSDGAEVEMVTADGLDKGSWAKGAQEQDLGCLAEGATREAT